MRRGTLDPGEALGGVPSELRSRLTDVLDREPAYAAPQAITFERRFVRTSRFNLRELLRPTWRATGLALLLVAAESLLQQVGPLMVQRAIDHGIAEGDLDVVVGAASVYLVAVLLGGGASSARIWLTGRVGQRLMKQLRIRVFTHFQLLHQAFFTEERVGRLLTRMTSDIDALAELLQDGIINLLVQGFTLVVVTTIMLALDVRLTLLVVVVILPVMVALTWWFRTASTRTYAVVRERIAELLADLAENLHGSRVVTATNRQDRNAELHRALIARHRQATIDSGDVQSLYGPSVQTLGRLAQVLVIAAGGAMVRDGGLTVGELTAFVLYLAAFFAPLQELVSLYTSYQSGQAAVHKIADLLDVRPEVLDPTDPVSPPEVRGAIHIVGVDFSYVENHPILNGVDLAIAEGETIAFVGETGAGKSTMAKLLTRTYDPTNGSIQLDGVDLRALPLDTLRASIGVVPQEPFLFSGTLRDNLTVGRPEAPDDHVAAVARALGLGPLLDRLGGVDGRIAENGVGLSSGERQLVALARAMIPEPQLLLLDEATSNLDLESERTVEAALDVALQDRTAILIAHRLSTAERADRVVVFKGGQIVESGPHPELMAAGGHYARMFQTWTETNS